ncbi:MAG: hypothetical protein F6K30_21815 [Cyanothece sp. SIO2G6]|nr:hypothetical protein [Cyanothece sp. SIO2G6]
MYADPSGQVTITSLQSAQQINSILERTRSAVARQAYDHFIDQAQGVVGDLIRSALNSLMPDMWMSNVLGSVLGNQQDDVFERFVRNQICGFFGGSHGSNSLASRLWFTPEIDTKGNPQSSGFNCSNQNSDFFENFDPKYPNPDYLFKKGNPKTTDGKPKAWLVGDMKRTIRRLHADYVGGEHPDQWKAIHEYADYSNGHQFTPLTFFIVWRPGSGTERQIQVMEQELAKEGFEKNVIVTLAKIF